MYDLDLLVTPYLQKNLGECPAEELKSLTDQYPYFAPAQLALLKKLKEEAGPEYTIQLQKAVLYYYDPIRFEAFVNSQDFITEINFPAKEISLQTEDTGSTTSAMQEEPVTSAQETKPTEEIVPNQETTLTELPEEETRSDISESTIEPVAREQEETIPVEESEEVTTAEDEAQDIYTDTILNVEQETAKENPETSTETRLPLSTEPLQAIPLPQPVEPKETELSFEPYHTVDYFASQGIKLSQEEAANDRVGKQLKSFTAWLKTMKRLPVPELSKTLDTTNEHKVQNLAEHSLENADIVTEAMAEVWAKQGNKGKAIEVYNKLSLQNPSKKVYFAAKIENLKND